MSDVGIRKAFNKVKPKNHSTMSLIDIAEQSKPITVRELEEIRRQYPINEFEMRGRGTSNTKVLSSTNNSITQHEPQQSSGSALVPNQGEAFEIPANDGLFVIHQDSTYIEHEAVKPLLEELIQQLNTIVTQIDFEEVCVDDALRSQLEPFQHQYETLSELAKPITSRPIYV
jgi:hypothetical protein